MNENTKIFIGNKQIDIRYLLSKGLFGVVSEDNHAFGMGDSEIFGGTIVECIDYIKNTPISTTDDDDWDIEQGREGPYYVLSIWNKTKRKDIFDIKVTSAD